MKTMIYKVLKYSSNDSIAQSENILLFERKFYITIHEVFS